MDNQFTFDEEKYDFWSLYEAIRTYYPLGKIYLEDEIDFLDESQETLAREKVIHEHIYVEKNYSERWGKFKKYLKQSISKKLNL